MITRQGIEAAISGLKYGNPESLKYKLVHAIWACYGNAEADPPPENIAAESLIKALWTVKDDDAVNRKKRNLSNTKSAVNRDLKTAYKQGMNPEGVVIGRNNCFTMCDEAKDDLLSTVDLAETRDTAASMRAISDSLATIRSTLAQTVEPTDPNGTGETGVVEELRQAVQEVAEALGMAPFDGTATGTGGDREGEGGTAPESIDLVEEEATEDPEVDAEPAEEILEEVWEEDLLPTADLAEASDASAFMSLISDSLATIRSALAQTPEGTDLNGTTETGVAEALRQAIQETAEALGLGPFDAGATGPGGDGEGEASPPLAGTDLVEEDATDDLEDETEAEEEILEEVWEEETPADEAMDAGEISASTGLPLDGPVDSDIQSWAQDRDPRLLAEAFDGYLGTMERFYNQYLLIPEGLYSLPAPQGKLEGTKTERPVAAFYMGKFPVTNALFEVFVERTGYLTLAERLGHSTVYCGRLSRREDATTGRVTYRSTASVKSLTVPGACWHRPTGPGSTLHQKKNHPVVHVALEDVLAFAAWTGKRLPTEREWEAAAGTDRGLPFPWGDTWMPEACNVEDAAIGDTTPVSAFEGGENELGIGDTLGNVWEWTADIWHADAGSRYQVLKGGSWISRQGVCLSDRLKLPPRSTSNICGFRLCVD